MDSVISSVVQQERRLNVDRHALTRHYNVPRSSMTHVRALGAAPGLSALIGLLRTLGLGLRMTTTD